MFSIVFDEGGRRRRLPSLYVGRYQVFAHRDIALVVERLDQIVLTIALAQTSFVYALQACEFEGTKGLYVRDFFNRSHYRRKLARRGFTFASDPYCILNRDGSMENRDWGRFKPRFAVLMRDDEEDPDKLVRTTGGGLAFALLAPRLGPLEAEELTLMTSLLDDVTALSSANPTMLVEGLRREVFHRSP